MSTSQSIRERIASQPAGEPFTPALFAGLGSRAAIDQTLMRLAKASRIERIGHGLQGDIDPLPAHNRHLYRFVAHERED